MPRRAKGCGAASCTLHVRSHRGLSHDRSFRALTKVSHPAGQVAVQRTDSPQSGGPKQVLSVPLFPASRGEVCGTGAMPSGKVLLTSTQRAAAGWATTWSVGKKQAPVRAEDPPGASPTGVCRFYLNEKGKVVLSISKASVLRPGTVASLAGTKHPWRPPTTGPLRPSGRPSDSERSDLCLPAGRCGTGLYTAHK
jgi:hypothetical protein